jgi:hypothetical protein
MNLRGAGRWPSFRGRLRGSLGGVYGPYLAFGAANPEPPPIGPMWAPEGLEGGGRILTSPPPPPATPIILGGGEV